jgi:hypothetical protein
MLWGHLQRRPARDGRASALDRGGPEELAARRKKAYQLLFFIASSGAGRLRLNLKLEPGDIVLRDAHGKIGSYSYFTVFAALAHLIFPSSQEKFWTKQEHWRMLLIERYRPDIKAPLTKINASSDDPKATSFYTAYEILALQMKF